MRAWHLAWAGVVGLVLGLVGLSGVQAGVQIGELRDGRYEVSFRYTPVIGVREVALAGSFNGWDPRSFPMSDPDGDGTWELTVPLAPGRYLYKYVLDGHIWQTDPDNPQREPDGFEGQNSVLTLGEDGHAAAGVLGDGEIDGDFVSHGGPGRDAPFGAASYANRLDDAWVELRLHTLAGDVQAVDVSCDGDATAMRRIETRDGRDEWWALVRVPPRGRYHFILHDGEREAEFHRRGLGQPRSLQDFRAPDRSSLDVPAWVRDAVFYQIFPERFANGDPENDPGGTVPWGSEPTYDNFMGGDLAGVLAHLDHLQDLGVTAVYFNPLFKAGSNHKYDTWDYMQVDPAFGDEGLLKELVAGCHERGIRVVLDGVFNHSGDGFWAFQDVISDGPDSPYVDWYRIHEFPVVVKKDPGYDAWWGFGHLPEFNVDNPETREHLLSVGAYWLREAGIDGWRLDVPNEIAPPFWREFRDRVRAARADTYIVGEIWVDPRPWVAGDMFDAVMNYPLRSLLIDSLAQGKGTAEDFHRELARVLYTPPAQATLSAYNLLGSHDTPRIRTVAGGAADRARLAYTALFTLPGAPAVYYGDEIGMEGGKDPECRRAFPWEDPDGWDRTTLEWIQRLAALRKTQAALRSLVVEPELLAGSDHVIAYRRGDLVVVLNPRGVGLSVTMSDPADGAWRDLLDDEWATRGQEGVLGVDLPPYGARVLSREAPAADPGESGAATDQ